MTLGDLTDRKAVLEAIAEFDRLGRETFLARYGFRHFRSYVLQYGGHY